MVRSVLRNKTHTCSKAIMRGQTQPTGLIPHLCPSHLQILPRCWKTYTDDLRLGHVDARLIQADKDSRVCLRSKIPSLHFFLLLKRIGER